MSMENYKEPRRLFLERCAYSAFGLSILPFTPPMVSAAPSQGKTVGGPGLGKAKHVIWIMLDGGLSQIDTLDPKEGGTPGKLIRTKAGDRFTSFLPKMAQVADKMCVIRSMHANIGVHAPAQYYMRTAFKENSTIYHPMLGAWAHKLLGPSHKILPSTVSVNEGSGVGQGFLPSTMSRFPFTRQTMDYRIFNRREDWTEFAYVLPL